MSTQPPEGLRLLALVAAFFASVMMLVVAAAVSAGAGGTAGLLCVLAAVAAEALWHGRPWAFRASAALALGCFFGLMEVLTIVAPYDLTVAGSLLGLYVGGVVFTLFYIRRQLAALAQASQQTRVAVPGSTP
jgi:hypothetical protein